MSRNYYIIGILALALYSCSSPASKENKTDEPSVASAVSSLSGMANASKEIEKNYNKLAHTTPLTNDQLKAWMPEELDGMKRTSYTVGGQGFIKITSLKATYENEDKTKKIALSLMDGADSLAAGAMSLVQMAMAANYETSDERHVEKTVTREGIKAMEEYQKDKSRASLKFISEDRYLITLEGDRVDEDQLWKAVKALHLDELGK